MESARQLRLELAFSPMFVNMKDPKLGAATFASLQERSSVTTLPPTMIPNESHGTAQVALSHWG